MPIIPIPGGTATLRDKLVSERHYRILEAAYIAAAPALKKVAERASEEPTEQTDFEEDSSELGANSIEGMDHKETMMLLDLQDAAIVAFLESWTLPQPLPTLETVGDLERGLFKALAAAAQPLVGPSIAAMRVDFSPRPGKIDPATGEENFTGASSGSNGHSWDEAQNQLTTTQKADGESIVIDSFII